LSVAVPNFVIFKNLEIAAVEICENWYFSSLLRFMLWGIAFGFIYLRGS